MYQDLKQEEYAKTILDKPAVLNPVSQSWARLPAQAINMLLFLVNVHYVWKDILIAILEGNYCSFKYELIRPQKPFVILFEERLLELENMASDQQYT